MDQLTYDEFMEFLGSYEDGSYVDRYGIEHKFYDSLTELSRSDSKPYDSLITNKFPMFGLDWMVKDSSKWKDSSRRCEKNPRRCNHRFPKTVDALFCKKNRNDETELHIIEFKFIPSQPTKDKLEYLFLEVVEKNNKYKQNEHKSKNKIKKCFDDDFVDDFIDVRKYFFDKLENSLQLKPYEAIYIALPGLYEEYCENKNKEKKDINGYLASIKKYYWVCIGSGSSNETNIHSQAQSFEKYYRRMEPEILKEAKVRVCGDFEIDLKEDILSDVP